MVCIILPVQVGNMQQGFIDSGVQGHRDARVTRAPRYTSLRAALVPKESSGEK
jgi:hypothetical protein